VEECRSVFKVAAFIVASTSAFLVAFFLAGSLFEAFPGNGTGASLNFPAPIFACAGFVGAYLVLAAGLFLFGPRNIGLLASLRVGIWAIGGALLGAVGEAADATWIDPTHNRAALLFLIWQPGVALLLGLMLALERHYFSTHLEVSGPKESLAHPNWSRLIFGGVVLVFLFGFLGRFVFQEVWAKYAFARRDAAIKVHLAKAPPMSGLLAVEPVASERIFVMRDISGLSPWGLPGSTWRDGVNSPTYAKYEEAYNALKNTSGSDRRQVVVDIDQMPNADWARYKADDPANASTNRLKEVTKFNSRIMENDLRYNGDEGRLCYLWPSSNFFVSVCFQTRPVDEEFLNQYLKKYPSSL
jgi:hypothetical protein